MKNVMLGAATAMLSAGTAFAAPVNPTSYDMLNGETGSYQYWDESYAGPGATGNPTGTRSALSGGLGQLTDGYIETRNWDHPAVERPSGPGPYVGWASFDPVITFHFAEIFNFDRAVFYFDADYSGGVRPPSSVSINGQTQNVPTPGSSAPFAFTFDLRGQAATDTLVAQIFNPGWTMLSEVTFEGSAVSTASPVPLPAGAVLLASGLAVFGATRRKK